MPPDESTATATPATGAPEGGAPATETNGAAVGTEHFDRIMSRVDELGGNVSQLMERLPAQEPEPERDPVEAMLADLGYEVPEGEPEPTEEAIPEGLSQREIAEMVHNLANTAFEKQVTERLNPVLSALAERDLDASFVALEEKYPKLLDQEWQGKLINRAEEMMGESAQQALQDPMLVELMHKSLLLDEHAANQTPVGDVDAGLERPSGANPAATSGEDPREIASRIARGTASEGRKRLQDAGLV